MKSIGKKWPSDAPRGDYKVTCQYCGQKFRRSQMQKDGAGRLSCPYDFGADEVTLSLENAAAAAVPRRPIGQVRDGVFKPSGAYSPVANPSNGNDGKGPVTPPSGGWP